MACNWLWARDEIKRARSKTQGKKLAGNTWLVVSRVSPTSDWKSDECIYACEFHGTEVVRYFPNGTVAASLNGWNTVTTKARVRDFSPMSIGTDRGQVLAWSGTQRWLGGEYTWFYWKDEHLVFKDGGLIPNLIATRRKDQVPKRRDTLARPLEGDAFKDGLGMWVVAKDTSSWPRRLRMFPYFGDHEDDRALCVTDDSWPPRDLLSNLELLAAAHEGGLRPMDRFIWKNPTGGA